MSDNSRLFAKIEDQPFSSAINKIQDKKNVTILSQSKRYTWTDFQFKNECFSIFSGTGDLLFFVENSKCPEKLLKELLMEIEAQ